MSDITRQAAIKYCCRLPSLEEVKSLFTPCVGLPELHTLLLLPRMKKFIDYDEDNFIACWTPVQNLLKRAR